MTATLDTTRDPYVSHPHQELRRARAAGPVAFDSFGHVVVLGYHDCLALLRDPRLSNDYNELFARHEIHDGPLVEWWRLVMLNMDPPEHTQLRTVVSSAFTPRRVNALAGLVADETNRVIDAHAAGGRMDLVADIGHAIPLTVMGTLLGIPVPDHEAFERWMRDLNHVFADALPSEHRVRAEAAIASIDAYVEDLVEQRRRQPGDDLLSAMVDALQVGQRLSHPELVALVIQLLIAGVDTSRSMLSVASLLLALDEDVADRLRTEPEMLNVAIEEVLRYEPPIPELLRKVRAELEVGGVTVAAGSTLAMSLMAANRDPDVYEEPDRFDPWRDGPPSLSFGWGTHFCLGHAVARLEARAVLRVLFDRCRRLRLQIDQPAWTPLLRVRNIEALPVKFDLR